MKRGFTLIEVMMAAGIIGLGLLGLIALLAGAARLQQTSSQTSESVLIAKNAESLIRQSLASVTLNPTVASPIDTNRWYLVPKDDRYDHLELTDPIWPIAEGTEGTPWKLFDRKVPKNIAGDPRDAGPPQSGQYSSPGPYEMPDYAERSIPIFSNGGILPDSLVFRVRTIVTPSASTTPAWDEIGVNEVLYFRPTNSTVPWPDGDTFSEPDWIGPDVVYFYAGGDAARGPGTSHPDGPDFIAVDVQHQNLNGDPAWISSFRIADVANTLPMFLRMIDEITIDRPYRFINTKLISLQDRTSYAADKTREDGRRPEFGFGVLYRTLSGGGSQAGVFIYGLQAPSRIAEWNPMETNTQIYNNGDSPIAEVGQGAAFSTNVDLGFDSGGDEATDLYYLEVDEDFGWVVAPDQVVLVSWADSVGGGADDAVRVVRREVMLDGGNPTGMVRGYLERGPRHANHAIHDGGTGTESVEVWVVKDIAVSDEDGSTWRLRPLRFVAFQLDG